MRVSIEKGLTALEGLEPVSRLVTELEAALADEGCDAKDLARIIEQDPALASRVMKLANAAYYAVPGGVSSVERSVLTVGFSAIHQVTLCLQSYAILNRSGQPVPASFTDHAQAVATLSRQVARMKGYPSTDEAYAAGLLHDLGRVAIFALFSEQAKAYVDALGKGAADGPALEQELIGVDHQWVGAQLAKKWRFPPALTMAVSGHHDGGKPREGGDMLGLLADIVSCADAWSFGVGHGDLKCAPPAAPPTAFERLGLPLTPSPELQAELRV